MPVTSHATDAGFAGRPGKAAVDGHLGLARPGDHARDELIEIDSTVPRVHLTRRLLNDLARQVVRQQGR